MNWTCLVYGAPMMFALTWYAVSARKWFKGPKVNIDHMMLGRVAEDHSNIADASGDKELVRPDSGSDSSEWDIEKGGIKIG